MHAPDEDRRRWLAALAALTGAACTNSSDNKPAVTAASAAHDAATQDAARMQPQAYRVVLENDRIRVLEFVSRPGTGMCGIGTHSHPAHLTVALSDAAVRVTLPNGQTINAASKIGDVMWSEAETHATENVGGADARALIVEIKDAGASRRTG